MAGIIWAKDQEDWLKKLDEDSSFEFYKVLLRKELPWSFPKQTDLTERDLIYFLKIAIAKKLSFKLRLRAETPHLTDEDFNLYYKGTVENDKQAREEYRKRHPKTEFRKRIYKEDEQEPIIESSNGNLDGKREPL